MTRDYLTRAFAQERRDRALGRSPRPFRQARRYPQWLSHPTGRPIGSRREPRAESPWTGVIAIALSIAFLMWIAWYAPQMPRREPPPDPRGYVVGEP